tara:strand:- start:477 stop:626 length:150 start_codon:yes stop_codon:yes gene_type:complete
MKNFILTMLAIFIFASACFKHKKTDEMVQKPRETGIFDEEEIDKLPERK